jgi:hypothetical protein
LSTRLGSGAEVFTPACLRQGPQFDPASQWMTTPSGCARAPVAEVSRTRSDRHTQSQDNAAYFFGGTPSRASWLIHFIVMPP